MLYEVLEFLSKNKYAVCKTDEGPFAFWERRISATKASLFSVLGVFFSVKLDLLIPLRFPVLQTASLNSEAIRP